MSGAETPIVAKRTKRKPTKIAAWDCGNLRIKVRGGWFHATGTIIGESGKERVREALSVRGTKENKPDAEREARRVEAKTRAKLGGGVVKKSIATLVAERFQSHIGPSDQRILRELTKEFRTRILYEIPPEAIVAFVDDRQLGNSAETRERYISTVCAFLNRQIARGQYPALPSFVRDKKARNPDTRARRPVQQFRVELLALIINAAHITIGIQLHIEYIGGTRVSSILHGATLRDLDMAGMTLTFRDTKNGEDVPVALPETIRGQFEEYLAWRAIQVSHRRVAPGSDQPLFLTYKGKPYKPNAGAWGTQNKTGFNAAKRRAIVALNEQYEAAISAMKSAGDQTEAERLVRLKADDLKILNAITQHWLRHKFATDMGRLDLQAAKRQGGWKSLKSVLGYLIADAEYQRELVQGRESVPSLGVKNPQSKRKGAA
jgi:site-specific recombinase XerD